MVSTKHLYISLFSINVFIGLLCLGLYTNLKIVRRNTSESSFLPQIAEPIEDKACSYTFDDPAKAHFFLKNLDIYEIVHVGEIPHLVYGTGKGGGFKVNDNYCDEHRAYFVEHPELIFEKLHFITNYNPKHLLKTQVMPSLGALDLHPEVHSQAGKLLDEFKYDMRIDTSMFLMHNLFYYKRQIGKQFSCLTQMSNHVPGQQTMAQKGFLGSALVDYAKRYDARPNCFNFEKLFPKTWIMTQKDQCLKFFKEFNSPRYQQLKEERGVVYFRKIGKGVHEGKGVFPVNDVEENYINNLYQNGTLCGTIKDDNLMQYNIHNLLLINNRRFGFRMYMLIASSNPLLVYFHDGYAELSIYNYDPSSKTLNTFLTNIKYNATQAQAETGFTESELEEANVWSLEDFHQHLMQNGRITDPNWLDNYVRPEMKKVMVHILRTTQQKFFKKSSVFEIYGFDFVMDENLNLWFIEANIMPLITGWTNKTTIMFNKMLTDLIEIEIGLLRSRVKRIIRYINILSEEESSESFLLRLDEKREEFQEVIQNRFEPQFEPKPGNGFQKIMDAREEGVKKYTGLLSQECL